jgi:hypothetical protein
MCRDVVVNELGDVDRDLFDDTAINAGSFNACAKPSRSAMRRMPQPDQFGDHRGNAPGMLLGDADALKGRRDARLAVRSPARRRRCSGDRRVAFARRLGSGPGRRSFLFRQIVARCVVSVDCVAYSFPSRSSMRPARLCRARAAPTWFGRAPLHAAVISCCVLPVARART